MYKINEFKEVYNKEINDFVISIYVDEYGFEEHRANLEKHDNNIYQQSGGKLWYATDEQNNIIGTIAIYKHNDKEMELKRFYVKKECRGTGLSKELYKIAIDTCISNSINKVSLGTFDKFEKAIHFYTKNGFEEYKTASGGRKYFKLNLV